MNISIQNSITQLGAEFVGSTNEATIDAVAIDSRSLQNSATTLFFAIVGPNNDAHSYIKDVIEKGVQYFVVTHIPRG